MNKKYQNIETAKKLYSTGSNVTSHFQNIDSKTKNSPDIIEIAYELQAGEYIKLARNYPEFPKKYTSEMADIINKYIKENDAILDVGTGELTVMAHLMPKIKCNVSRVLAFDISWSRLQKGLKFAAEKMGESYKKLEVFVADMFEIPISSHTVEVLISNHALEPNGGREIEILTELFRVTSKYCILFEPCYEINSDEGKKRMDKMGYIKNLEKFISDLGGNIVEKITMKTISNPLNPTVCYVIELNKRNEKIVKRSFSYCVPGTDFELKKIKNVLYSPDLYVSFPIIDTIPILKNEFSIITSAMSEFDY